jgi:hypothetical protein
LFTLAEAAEALALEEEVTIRVLEDLLEASVISAPDVEVVAHSVMYEMPALLYAYARELAVAAATNGDKPLTPAGTYPAR